MAAPPDLDALSFSDLKAMVLTLLARVAALDLTVAAQRDEIARLKGRPVIKPSGMEKGTQPKPGGKRTKRRGRGKVMPRVTLETEVLRAAAVPPGSQFKGYEPYQGKWAARRRIRCQGHDKDRRWLRRDCRVNRLRGTNLGLVAGG